MRPRKTLVPCNPRCSSSLVLYSTLFPRSYPSLSPHVATCRMSRAVQPPYHFQNSHQAIPTSKPIPSLTRAARPTLPHTPHSNPPAPPRRHPPGAHRAAAPRRAAQGRGQAGQAGGQEEHAHQDGQDVRGRGRAEDGVMIVRPDSGPEAGAPTWI